MCPYTLINNLYNSWIFSVHSYVAECILNFLSFVLYCGMWEIICIRFFKCRNYCFYQKGVSFLKPLADQTLQLEYRLFAIWTSCSWFFWSISNLSLCVLVMSHTHFDWLGINQAVRLVFLCDVVSYPYSTLKVLLIVLF